MTDGPAEGRPPRTGLGDLAKSGAEAKRAARGVKDIIGGTLSATYNVLLSPVDAYAGFTRKHPIISGIFALSAFAGAEIYTERPLAADIAYGARDLISATAYEAIDGQNWTDAGNLIVNYGKGAINFVSRQFD